MSICISSLSDCVESIPQLAHWHLSEWRKLGYDTSLEARIAKLQSHTQSASVPQTFVALFDPKCAGEPVGSASLILSQLTNTSYPSYWLANVYVKECFRKRGIASRLIEYVQYYASTLGLKKLYLSTTDHKAFYLNRQWQYLHESRWRGHKVDIMCLQLLLECQNKSQNDVV